MPGRLTPLITNEIYHVVNRGIDDRYTFWDYRSYERGKLTAIFYTFRGLPTRLSKFLFKSKEEQNKLLEELKINDKKWVDLLSYCFMPNHFHLLLRQREEKGISKYMSNFLNSYTKYFNTRKKRKGPLFYDQFKAVNISTDEQLLHVSRYIHLNPFSGYVTNTLEELENYPWSSFSQYLKDSQVGFCETETILFFFKGKKGRNSYRNFVLKRANYQRKLQKIKHLNLEEEG